MSSRKPGKSDDTLQRGLHSIQDEWNRDDAIEPPDLLDQAVMNAARRDLEGAGSRKSSGRRLSWLGGFATAAVAVLAVTLVWFPDTSNDLRVSPGGEVPAKSDKAMPQALENDKQFLSVAPEPEEKALMERDSAAALSDEPPAMKREARRVAVPEAGFAVAELASEPAADEEALPSPEDWLEQLKRLKETGQVEELRAGLTAFRSAYPDWPVPAELEDATP